MPVEVHHSPPPLHHPGEVTRRPKGILKNPSFSGPSGPGMERQISPTKEQTPILTPSSAPLDPQESKEITLQNTLQNAGHRRSSSAARRASNSRRHSSALMSDEDPEKMRLKWDEANLYQAEQESGGRMKITEPKTPYQYGDQNAMEEEDEEDDVAIDPRYVNVDEIDMAKSKTMKKHRGSDIPGLELGEPEEDLSSAGVENERIVRAQNLSRESSKEKHVSVSSGSGEGMEEQVGMPTKEEQEKHRQFEERRKKHYEMGSMKGLLGHPDDVDEMDEDGDSSSQPMPTSLPNRSVNGGR